MIVVLEKEIASLQAAGEHKKARLKREQHADWMAITQKGEAYYQRYADFRVGTLWAHEKTAIDELLAPYRKQPAWEERIAQEYVDRKHLPRMEQLLARHGDKIQTIRNKLATE